MKAQRKLCYVIKCYIHVSKQCDETVGALETEVIYLVEFIYFEQVNILGPLYIKAL